MPHDKTDYARHYSALLLVDPPTAYNAIRQALIPGRSIADAAAKLGVSRRWLFRMLKAHPAIRGGK